MISSGASRSADEAEKRLNGYSLSQTLRLIRSDIAFRCAYEHKPANWKTGLRMLRHPGVACVVRYRLQCFFYFNHLVPLGWLMKYLNLVFYGVEIHERARIGSAVCAMMGPRRIDSNYRECNSRRSLRSVSSEHLGFVAFH